jgi:hypothetical protein
MEGEEDCVQTVRTCRACVPPRAWRTPHVRVFSHFRYASLYFVTCVDNEDNELVTLETIHHFVEVLDRYFGNVRAAHARSASVLPT